MQHGFCYSMKLLKSTVRIFSLIICFTIKMAHLTNKEGIAVCVSNV